MGDITGLPGLPAGAGAMLRSAVRVPAAEFAIRLGDGSYQTGFDDRYGEHVVTWSERGSEDQPYSATWELERIRSCGNPTRYDNWPRDENLINAVLVERQVTAWQALQ